MAARSSSSLVAVPFICVAFKKFWPLANPAALYTMLECCQNNHCSAGQVVNISNAIVLANLNLFHLFLTEIIMQLYSVTFLCIGCCFTLLSACLDLRAHKVRAARGVAGPLLWQTLIRLLDKSLFMFNLYADGSILLLRSVKHLESNLFWWQRFQPVVYWLIWHI